MPKQGFYFDHVEGERAGSVDHFDQDLVSVGRAEESTIVFTEMGVSWAHAELRLRDGAFWVIDKGSTNGTYVNDERAHNARLADGDVIKFGKKNGPIVRFRLGTPPADAVRAAPGGPRAAKDAAAKDAAAKDAAGKAEAAKDAAGKAEARPRPTPTGRLGAPLADLAAVEAAESAASSADDSSADDAARLAARLDPAAAHSDLPPAAPVAAGGAAWLYVVILFLGLLTCGALGVAAVLYLETVDQGEALKSERDRAARLGRDLKLLRDEQEERLRGARQEAREDERRLAAVELERAERAREQVKTWADEQVAGLQGEVARLEHDLGRAEAELRVLRMGTSPAGVDWQEIERRLSSSVVLVATHLEGQDRHGNRIPLHCFGTGFFVSHAGHIVTNKHVVQPWKYRPLAERMAREDITVIEDSYHVCVWVAGTRYVRQGPGGQPQLDLSTGFSTAQHTLQVVRTAPDRWASMALGGDGARALQIHEEYGNNDVAILQAPGARVPPIPTGPSNEVVKLDEVMVMGFPAGISILEAGVAETSPARGQVRKVEDTIQVSVPIVGGNSGGPLIDDQGRVVGIATRVVEGTETLGSCLRIEHALQLLQGGSW